MAESLRSNGEQPRSNVFQDPVFLHPLFRSLNMDGNTVRSVTIRVMLVCAGVLSVGSPRLATTQSVNVVADQRGRATRRVTIDVNGVSLATVLRSIMTQAE